MPERVIFDNIMKLEPLHRRRQLLINIWRSVPGVTDRIYIIPQKSLEEVFWPAFIEELKDKEDMKAALTYVSYQTGGCGPPWKSALDTWTGQDWATAFMFVALQMEGFLGELDGEHWVPKKYEGIKLKQEVEKAIKKEVYDEWKGEVPILDRIFWGEACRLHDYTNAGKLVMEDF